MLIERLEGLYIEGADYAGLQAFLETSTTGPWDSRPAPDAVDGTNVYVALLAPDATGPDTAGAWQLAYAAADALGAYVEPLFETRQDVDPGATHSRSRLS